MAGWTALTRVVDAIDDLNEELLGLAGGGGAPEYLVLAAHASLANERVFTAGGALVATDGGAGGLYTLDHENLGALPDAHHAGFIALEDNAGTAVTPAADDRIQFTDDGVINADASGNTLALSIAQAQIDHGIIGGLTDDDHGQYALLAGRPGGQTLQGGTMFGNNLTLESNSSLVKGSIFLGSASRFELAEAAGQLRIPTPGSGAGLLLGGDAQWYRAAANIMRTPDAVTVDGRLTTSGGGPAVFNEDGNDVDFRVEGNTEPDLLFVDASLEQIALGIAAPEGELDIDLGTADPQVNFDANNALPYGTEKPDLILTRRHSAAADAMLGLAGPLIDFRLTNIANEWSLAQIVATGDPAGGTGFQGGLAFLVSQGGAANPAGRRDRGAAPIAAMSIGPGAGNDDRAWVKVFGQPGTPLSHGEALAIYDGDTSVIELHASNTAFGPLVQFRQGTGGFDFFNYRAIVADGTYAFKWATKGAGNWQTDRIFIHGNAAVADIVFHNSHFIVNESGVDANMRVEGDTDPNLFTTDGGLDRVGVGVALGGHLGKLHVDQASGVGAEPVLYLDQGDLLEEMIEFNTAIGVGNPIEAVGAKTLTTTHFIKVTVPGGLTRYFPVGTIA